MLKMLQITLLLLSMSISLVISGREYTLPPSEEEYHPSPCGSNCPEGGCAFTKCGKDSNPVSNCEGGLCEFIHCVDATCAGGSCIFVNCKGAGCGGGACHHVNPVDTLTDGYCKGGGCMLNGEGIKATLKNELTV